MSKPYDIEQTRQYTLSIDFDGVLHRYDNGWQGPDVVDSPPVEGALEFLAQAVDTYDVCIYSSRSRYRAGRRAMKQWLERELKAKFGTGWYRIYHSIRWPWFKPAAWLTIDDRAMKFEGHFPTMLELSKFKTWQGK